MEAGATQRLACIVIGIGTLAALAHAQSVTEPHFEVASVKSGTDVFSTKPTRSAGKIRWTTQLCYLIGYANHLDFSRVSGKSCGSVYAVEAKFDPAATEDQVRSMFKELLADRFKLQAHRVTTETDGYAMVLEKRGLKIKEAEPLDTPDPETSSSSPLKAQTFIASTMPEAGVIAVKGRKVSLSQLAETLQRSLETPVWDRTGLSGNYDFDFRYALSSGDEVVAAVPSLTAALRETLGLKLEKQKGPVETIVIDHIEKPLDN